MKSLNFFIIFCFSIIFSQNNQPFAPLDLVTIPTSGTLPKGSFTIETLLVKDGGLVPKLSIGITENFYIGLSYGVQDFISEKKMSTNKPMPELQLKYRIFSETTRMPAIVVGLDTQGKGRFIQRANIQGYSDFQRYEQKAWGLYLVASKNWDFIGNFGFHVGINKNTWESDPYQTNNEKNIFTDEDINLFLGFDKEINRSFSFLMEYDSAINDYEPSIGYNLFGRGKGYLNAGIRLSISENMMIEIDFNDIKKNYINDDMMDGNMEYANRELKIIYFEKF